MQPIYTHKAQLALKLAEQSAVTLKQGHAGTEHLLLGLVMENTSVAARVLMNNGITEEKIIQQIRENISFERPVTVKDREGVSPRAF